MPQHKVRSHSEKDMEVVVSLSQHRSCHGGGAQGEGEVVYDSALLSISVSLSQSSPHLLPPSETGHSQLSLWSWRSKEMMSKEYLLPYLLFMFWF